MIGQRISKEFLRWAALVIIVLLITGIISGVAMLLSNKTAINSIVRPSPTVTSSPTFEGNIKNQAENILKLNNIKNYSFKIIEKNKIKLPEQFEISKTILGESFPDLAKYIDSNVWQVEFNGEIKELKYGVIFDPYGEYVVAAFKDDSRREPGIEPLKISFSSPVSGNKEVFLGEDFLITLPANPSTGYSWTADFDKNYLFLRSKDFVPDRVSPETVGAGDTEVFTFAPIKAGETIITMGYGRSWESKPSKRKVFKYNITGKTAVDPRCSQKVISKPCACGATGYEFDSDSGFCHTVSTGCCDFKTPFNSLEECQKTCENSTVSGNELKFETIVKRSYSHQKAQNNYVIKSEAEWIPVLQKTDAELPASIDFTKEMIIAVFQGERSTGGYNIEINKIIEKENVMEVSVLETSPGRGCMVTMAFTSPFQVVKVQKSDKEVVFKTEKVVIVCE